MKEPSVSIIIPAHNEEKTIGAVIISLLKQKYDKKEIIVVNDGSIDRTEDIINNFPTVKKINNHRNLGLAKSMNNGIKEAKGQIVIVLHADCIPKDNFWVKKMIEPFTDSSVGAVISQRIVEDRSKLNIAERLFDSINPQSLINKNKKPIEVNFFRDKCDAYRKDVIKKLGYFDDKTFFAAGEDTDLSMKMRKKRFKIVLSNSAAVKYVFSSHQRSVKGLINKSLQYGSCAYTLFKRHGYDGLQTRAFLFSLITFLLPPSMIINYSAMLLFYILFLFSFFLSARIPVLNRRIPFGMIISGISFIIFLYNPFMLSLDLIIPISVLLWVTIFCFYYSLSSCMTSIKNANSIFLLPIVFIFSLLWRFMTGIGYLKGLIGSLTKD